jgi:chromosome segregation ATPase
MNHLRPGAVLWLIPAFLLFLSGCLLKFSPRSPEDFTRETLRLEEKARAHEDSGVRAESHRKLAGLYLHYRNPQLNYGQALREFEIYLKAAPEGRKSDEVLNWVSALQELEKREKETSGLKERIKAMAWEREGQQQSLARLGSKNQELISSVERLQGQMEPLEKANRSLTETNRSLSEANRNLAEANRSLKAEIERVKDTLEKLRTLDRQMEEKRRNIR